MVRSTRRREQEGVVVSLIEEAEELVARGELVFYKGGGSCKLLVIGALPSFLNEIKFSLTW